MTTTLWLSLRVAAGAMLLILPLGVGAGWLLARRSFPGRALLQGLLMLPLVLPPVTVGYFLLLLLGRHGWIGAWLDPGLAFRFRGAVLAAAVVALPLVVRSVRVAFEMADPRLEEAAAVLGAGRTRVFLTVSLPLAAPGILSGFCLGFARAFGEFGATITFAGNIAGETRTLPLAIHSALQRTGGESTAWMLACLSVGTSFAAFLLAESLARAARRWGGSTP